MKTLDPKSPLWVGRPAGDGAGRRRQPVIDLQLFAEEEKQEEATPRRRRKAREEGQTYQSKELNSALVLLAAVFTMQMWGPSMVAEMESLARHVLLWGTEDLTVASVRVLFAQVAWTTLKILGPLFGATAIIGLAASVGQTGFIVTGAGLQPQLERINPVSGFQRMFSKRGLVEFAKAVLKVGVVAAVALLLVRGSWRDFFGLLNQPLVAALTTVGGVIHRLFLYSGLVLLVLAIGDFFYQRWEFEQSIRMSRREVKEERKETEGSPEIRERRREAQRELTRNRMLRKVPDADVVVTNPVHYAVALRYEPETMEAPTVWAKGAGLLAQQVKKRAEEAGVPVMEAPPVARSLYHNVDVGHIIPEALYQAVADILAHVWRLDEAGRTGRGERR